MDSYVTSASLNGYNTLINEQDNSEALILQSQQ